MQHFSNKKIRIRTVLTTLLFGLAISYFTYHALSGDRGVLAMLRLSNQIEDARKDLDDVHSERLYLQHRVNLLRTDSLDLDLLDEQARKVLGYAGSGEEVYLIKKGSQK